MGAEGPATLLRNLADHPGLRRWLIKKTRLRGPARFLWRAMIQPRTIRDELDVLCDYRTFKRHYGPIFCDGLHRANSSKRVVVVSLSNWISQVKIESLLAKTLQVRGYAPTILTNRSANWAVRYYQVCGFDRFVFFDERIERVPVEAVAQDAEALVSRATSIQAVKQFQYRGVSVGRQVLATMTRSRYASCEVNAPEFKPWLKALLVQAMRSVLAAEQVLEELQPTVALFLEKDYMGLGSLYDLALNRGVTTIQWCLAHRDDSFILKRFTPDTRNLHPKSLSEETWHLVSAMPWTADHEEALAQEFRLRYVDGRWSSYYNRPYGSLKSVETIRRQLDLDPSKKTATIFSHILWDSTFFWGEDLFDDYAEWLVETVKAACRNPTVNWIVKLHPANAWKLAREHVTGELYDHVLLRRAIGTLPNHVKVLDPTTDINAFALFSVTDYCLTVRGTIGIEMACHGIPVLTAGTGRYSGFGFTIDSPTRDVYLDRLARIQDVPRLTKEQTLFAKKYAYAIFSLRPWKVHSFENVYLPLRSGGHPLDHNVQIHLRSLQDLTAASDLQAFAEWAADSQAEDFLAEAPAS